MLSPYLKHSDDPGWERGVNAAAYTAAPRTAVYCIYAAKTAAAPLLAAAIRLAPILTVGRRPASAV